MKRAGDEEEEDDDHADGAHEVEWSGAFLTKDKVDQTADKDV